MYITSEDVTSEDVMYMSEIYVTMGRIRLFGEGSLMQYTGMRN